MSEVALPAGVTWRPLRREDRGDVRASPACSAVDGGYRLTASEMRDEFDAYGDHSETDSIGGFDSASHLVAAGWCQIPESAETERRALSAVRT